MLGVRYYWLFSPPWNCPTAEAMLTAGAGGRTSAWLRAVANSLRWLAEPSLAAGRGGATTPESILHPPPVVWEVPRTIDWSREQVSRRTGGNIRAHRGPDQPVVRRGSVADYVRAARQCGLSFIVFLEDSLAMDQARWDRLVAECKAESSREFAAVPG